MNPLIRRLASLLAPAGAEGGVWRLLLARSLRGFCDGFVAVLLPAYLLALGLSTLAVGLISTSTLLGSAIATMLVGVLGNRFSRRSMLLFAALVMVATGIGFSCFSTLWPLLVVAFLGTMNPSAGDVSLFLPIEHACLAEASETPVRTALFARYSLVGALSGALGALLAGAPSFRVRISVRRIFCHPWECTSSTTGGNRMRWMISPSTAVTCVATWLSSSGSRGCSGFEQAPHYLF